MSGPLLLLLVDQLLLRVEGGEGRHEGHHPAQARLQHLHLMLEGVARAAQGLDRFPVSGLTRFPGSG